MQMDKPDNVTWILEITPEFTDPELMTKYVKKFVTIEDFDFRYKDWPKVEGPCVVFGTFRCLTQMARNPDLSNYIFDDYAPLTCSSYYSYLYEYLGRLAFMTPMSTLPHMDLERIFGQSVFIRPNSNKKPFEAEVVGINDIEAYTNKYSRHLDELVILSEVLQIDSEYRCFCRNGKTFSHSSYMEDEYKPAPEHIVRFADSVAERVLETLGLNMVTVDVAVCGSDLKLIEIGGVNSWGIYGSNIQNFIEAMEQEAVERFNDLF